MSAIKKLIRYINPFIKKLYPLMFFGFIFHTTAQVLALAIMPVFYQRIIDNLLPEMAGNPVLYRYAYIAIGVFILITIFYRLGDYIHSDLQSKLMVKLNKEVFSKFINKDYHFYLDNFSGSLVAKFSKFSSAVVTIYDIINYNIIGTLVGLLAIFVILGQHSWYLVLLFSGWATLYLATAWYWAKKRAKTSLVRTRSFSKLTGQLSDGISNIGQVKSFGQEGYEEDYFDTENNRWGSLLKKDWNTFVHGLTMTSSINVFFQAGVVLMGISLWNTGTITTGFVVLLFLYIRTLMARIRHLGKALPNLSSAISDTREIIEIIEEPIHVSNNKFNDLTKGSNNISIKDVSFTYPNGDHVFENFNLEVPEGQKIGVVGKSGSGKTTLVKLLLRFYDPSNGELSVGENVIKNLSQQEYRNNFISFIPQETTLFHRSLRENIMYGNQDANEELFNEVVKSSYVEEFASRLEEGYETKVGERGIRLSGGQRQRVGIARAMLKKDAPILIMDEATSALDSQSEQYIQNSFEKLSDERTTIVIAHRLTTIQKMDRIIVMEQGTIVEDGSHDELIQKEGVYAGLWNSQIGGFITD
jgi:ATP-binding cassette subfamily B protein